MSEIDHIAGLIVVNEAGKVVFSVGRGKDPRIVSSPKTRYGGRTRSSVAWFRYRPR